MFWLALLLLVMAVVFFKLGVLSMLVSVFQAIAQLALVVLTGGTILWVWRRSARVRAAAREDRRLPL